MPRRRGDGENTSCYANIATTTSSPTCDIYKILGPLPDFQKALLSPYRIPLEAKTNKKIRDDSERAGERGRQFLGISICHSDMISLAYRYKLPSPAGGLVTANDSTRGFFRSFFFLSFLFFSSLSTRIALLCK